MTVRILRTPADWDVVHSDWQRLAADVPFRGPLWLSTWWKHYATPACEPLVLVVYDQAQRPVGLAPWYVERGRTGQRTIRFLGSGEVCSDYLTILHEPSQLDAVVTAVADWLIAHAASPGSRQVDGWTRLHLDGGSAGDPMMTELSRRLSDGGVLVRARSPMNTWRLPLTEDWDTYLASLSKTHRKEVRRTQRNLFEPGRAVWHSIVGSHEFDAAWTLFVDLHQRRRQSLGQPGCFHSPRFAAFLRDVSEQLFQIGQLRLNWLTIDGRPAAAEYSLTGGDVVYAFQSGLEPEMLALEPGRVSMVGALESARADGFAAIDFLRGDEPYKPHWRAQPTPIVELHALPGGLFGRAQYHLWQMRDAVKRWRDAEPKPEPVEVE